MNKKKKILAIITVLAIFGVILLIIYFINLDNLSPTQPAMALSPFIYTFNVPGVLQEAGKASESKSAYWWLDSGGTMTVSGGTGHTNIGNMPALSKWRVLYNISNPRDTDYGYHPQNIFRLVTRTVWQDARQEAYFKIVKDNLSESTNRNSSNGILFFNRYQDGDNLYYTGIRVDGTAVIKKKVGGVYYTLAQEKIFDGVYNRQGDMGGSPNLLPENIWIGLRAEVQDTPDGSVSLKLFLDDSLAGKVDKELPNWKLVVEASDPQPLPAGFSGIRTDFMDVEFKDFKITADVLD